MKHFHHHSSFPLIIILLSLGLGVFMFYAFTSEEEDTKEQEEYRVEETFSVDADTYRSEMSSLMQTFSQTYTTSQDDLSRLLATEEVLHRLLDIRVPAEYKDLHLEFAVALNQLKEALRSTERNTNEPIEKIDEITAENPWLLP